MKTNHSFLQKRLQALTSAHSAPDYSVSFGFTAASPDYYLSLPFKRSFPAILISAVFLAAFSIPLFTMGDMLGGSGDDSLFSLVTSLFTLFWMLGWSTGVSMLLVIFLCLCLGKESLLVSDNTLVIRIGIPGIGIRAAYDGELIRHFRHQAVDIADGRKWRGSHIAFDYGDASVGFGSNVSELESATIISQLNGLFPLHDAEPVTLPANDEEPDSVLESRLSEPTQPAAVVPLDARPLRWNSLSSLALIAANLIPLFGVLVDGWDIGQIMLLFWAESAIIGYYNLCKMWKVGRWSLLFYGPFFVGHYGAFMAVHLLFIYALFGGEIAGDVDISRGQVFVDLLTLWPALLGLLISHGLSYYTNFVKTGRGEGRNMAMQMQEPYRRIIIMHLTLIFGGFLALSLGTGIAALMLLLLLKIIADLRGHLSQHSAQK